MLHRVADSVVRHLRPLLGVTVLAFGACGTDPAAPGAGAPLTALPRDLTAAERTVIAGSNAFAFDLLRAVATSAGRDSNLFVSPLSVSMAMSMTMNGTGGETQAQIRRTLGFGDMPLEEANAASRALIDLLRGIDRGVDFRIANSIWWREDFTVRPEFLERTRTSFDAEARAMDFGDPATLGTINDWVKANTNGKIERILEAIPSNVVMYLMNAIYFNGSWRNRFDAARTTPAAFTATTGAITSVPAMRQTRPFALHRASGFRAVDLPYGRGAFTMTVILPDAGTTLDGMLQGLDAPTWAAIARFADTVEVALQLPKFRLADEHRLNDPLQALGIRDAFFAGVADFSPLTPQEGLEISEVKHKTFVDVHEEGTEAAAVTSVGIRETSAPQLESFVVDRPFLFVLRERFSGAILFVGRVATLGG